MLALNPTHAYPAHGPFIPDAKEKIKEYIQHRQDREDQIIAVLRADNNTPKTSMEIVKVIYKDYPENLYEAAEKGVIMVLEKLEKEGAVVKEGEKWRILRDATADGQGRSGGRCSVL